MRPVSGAGVRLLPQPAEHDGGDDAEQGEAHSPPLSQSRVGGRGAVVRSAVSPCARGCALK